ncbi:MAG: hypothetical protein KatS3mg052_0667 [Candidatus Roseilinea sp.]|nr:MAG: hypothetical protein KatS3mg052_0667 [Candidatus Roseilinea sp.]
MSGLAGATSPHIYAHLPQHAGAALKPHTQPAARNNGVQRRKAIFAARLRRVPLFRWLLSLLRASQRQQLDRGVVQTALELEFPQVKLLS